MNDSDAPVPLLEDVSLVERVLLFVMAAALAPALAVAAAPAGGANLAIVAAPSAAYVSGDTTLQALNDGVDPRNSQDNRRGSYGNWNKVGTQWVQYEWSRPISTRRMDVYWWADGRGIRLPKACRLLYWDGNRFVPVGRPSGLGVAGDRYNTTEFDEVQTTRLRLEMDGDGTFSTGILEWKVYDSGKSPNFPPRAMAGVDRVVILGGKTWLTGAAATLSGRAPVLAWSKESGPGDVAFENPGDAATPARLAAVGDYVLKLTATDGALSASSTLRVRVEPPPPATHLEPIPAAPWKLNSPLWTGRAKALIVNWIPHCYGRLSEPDLKEGGIGNFVQAGNKLAGRPFSPQAGAPWANAYVYNIVEAMCAALLLDPQGDPDTAAAQKAMREKLDDWIPKILSAQEPDGYLQTHFTLSKNLPRWTRRGDHEGYLAGYFIESALAHYVMTGKTDARLYKAARKLADCWCSSIGPPPKREWYDGHQELELALVRLARFVDAEEGPRAGRKYVELAKFLLDCRRGGSEYDQSHLPVIRQYEAVGHAVRAVYSYAGMTDVAIETGDIDYWSAVRSIWDNLVNRKYYLTGGVGSGETSEGFGPNYSLRNNAYCESCASCGELFFQHRMNLAYKDAKYVDLYEDTLSNALLGSIDLEGRNFYYGNPLDSGGRRYPWHGCPCCVGNIPRTLLALPVWMYARSADCIYVNLYIGSAVEIDRVAGTRVQLVQATDYPWSGKVSITVRPAAEKRFTVRLRAPGRYDGELYTAAPESGGIAALAVNGEAVQPVTENGYVAITRTWKAGDRIDLELPMKVQRVKASPKVAADVGRVALRRGPLIYNIESADQDVGQALAPDSPLAAEWRGDLLGGVMVIKGTFAGGGPLLAIPNYARNNRAAPPDGPKRPSASLVWIKEAGDARGGDAPK